MAEDKTSQQQLKQLQQISKELEEQNKTSDETNKLVKTMSNIAIADQRLQFQDEQKSDMQFNLMMEQNSLLKTLVDKITTGIKTDAKESKGKGVGLLGALLPKEGIFKLISKGFKNLFSMKLFKKLLSPKIFSKIGKGLSKGLTKLNPIGLIIAGLFATFDFFKGFGNAEEIVGRTGLAAKFQAGFASVLSGLTLGFIDPKKISKWIDSSIESLKKGFTELGDMFTALLKTDLAQSIIATGQEIWTRVKARFNEYLIDPISNFVNSTIEFFTTLPQTISDKISEKLAPMIELVNNAFDSVKQMFDDYFINPIKNFIDSTVEKFNSIVANIENFGETIKQTAMAPITKTKEFLDETKQKYEDFKDKFSFSNLFGNDEKERNDLEKRALQTVTNNNQQKSSTTNNNVIANNSKTIVQSSSDMSTRTDDYINATSSAFAFGGI